MSTMPASHGHNEACCNIPPVVSTGYSAKGSYDEVNGMKTCAVPPELSKSVNSMILTAPRRDWPR
jgi:hypothetical protein